MLNEFYYFWLSWFLWIIITFFIPKERARTAFMSWILLTMIGSQIHLEIYDHYLISLAYIGLIIGTIIFYQLQTNLLSQAIIILIVTFSLISLKIFLSIAPIWLIFSESLMIVIMSTILTLLFTKELYKRLVILISSLCLTDLLYNIILFYYFDMMHIGQITFLYELTLGVVILLVVHFLQRLRRQWMNRFKGIDYKKYSSVQ